MRTMVAGPIACTGPVVAGILAAGSAEDVLRFAFPVAQQRGVPLHILSVGTAAPESITEAIERWADKYPDVPVTVAPQRPIDAAVTLAAAARQGAILVTAEPAGAHDKAVLHAVTRRVRCPVHLV